MKLLTKRGEEIRLERKVLREYYEPCADSSDKGCPRMLGLAMTDLDRQETK